MKLYFPHIRGPFSPNSHIIMQNFDKKNGNNKRCKQLVIIEAQQKQLSKLVTLLSFWDAVQVTIALLIVSSSVPVNQLIFVCFDGIL